MDDLKRCPFCGGKMEMTVSKYNECVGFFHAGKPLDVNSTCPIALGAFVHRVSADEAIEAWNRRAQDD